MEKSESTKELAKALRKFQENAPAVTRDAKANYGYYATLGNTIESTRAKLAECGLSFSQMPDGDGLTTLLMHESGEWIQATAKLMADKLTPQGQGSAITYMRRYALSAVLGIATEDDDDGTVASTKPVEKPIEKPVSKPWKAPTTAEKKATIKKLIDGRVQVPLEQTAVAYENYVFENFGLALEPQSYDAIIKALHE